jgi:hypothetical protein
MRTDEIIDDLEGEGGAARVASKNPRRPKNGWEDPNKAGHVI